MTASRLVSLAATLLLLVPGAQSVIAANHAAPVHLKWVQTLAVKDGDKESCRPPKFSEKELNDYFSRDARRVPGEGFARRDWSTCYGLGYATKDGQRVLQWELNLLGTGTLTWADGRKEFFACEDCLRQ